MNVGRVGMTSFGRSDFYDDIKRGSYCYAPNNMSDAYKFGALYAMLEVIRDEQREQAKMLANNQTVLRNLACDIAYDMAMCSDCLDTADKYENNRYNINTTA